MSIKTLSHYIFLLSLSLTVSSRATEGDLSDLPVGAKWPILRPKGPIKTPTKQHAEAAREESLALYRAGKYEDFYAYVRDTACFGRAHWLKDHIVWPLYGYYLLHVVSNREEGKVKQAVITNATTILDEVLEKKSPGYMAVRYNCMKNRSLEYWSLEPIRNWIAEFLSFKSWGEIPTVEKALFSEKDFFQIQSHVLAMRTPKKAHHLQVVASVASPSSPESESMKSTPSPDSVKRGKKIDPRQPSMNKLHRFESGGW
ncbi:MAG: hypothetical protein FJX18_05690 [Alphaproteobacteria bacterium]|nr:hypothetical protein [Alphaproteobacteria bacterium]